MSARASSASATRRPQRRARAAVRRRRLTAAVLGVGVLAVLTATLVAPLFRHAVKEIALPLRHEDIIRQQAREKDLDPALIAAVIYAESHFRDQTSPAGARGLMQITPATARYIARKSGGIAFEIGDLATPQINISYGSFYLRYLLSRYGDDERLAVAAYNAGETNVDRWVAGARARGEPFGATHIAFPETRAYVARVLDARRDYRKSYARQLGL